MSRLVIRWTIILVSVYLTVTYLVSDIFAVDIWRQYYYLLFELCVCLCISKQGVYHCKYIKWTAYAILAQDTLVCSDAMFNYLPTSLMALVPPLIIAAGLTVTTTLSARHYFRINKIKRQWRRNLPS